MYVGVGFMGISLVSLVGFCIWFVLCLLGCFKLGCFCFVVLTIRGCLLLLTWVVTFVYEFAGGFCF